ncbi:MAG: PadR family transcriptional regulator [Muribaculaceae bacterium]|nr:PadR family transcriptional regulator [Muribaculaceae bacterium]
MNIENLKSQMRKGMLEFCVLLILRQRAAYASEMIAALKDAHLIVVEGTLYPLLTRLKNDGLLAYEWQESTSGPPRKYYSLTPLGEQFLQQLSASWKEISDSINHLNNPSLIK